MIRILVALAVIFAIGCGGEGEGEGRDPIDEEYCGATGISYIVSAAYPHPWNSRYLFGDPWTLFSRETDPSEILPLMVDRVEGAFDLGDRLCIESVSPPCEDCFFDWDDNLHSFFQSSVQSSEGSITCTLEYPHHVLEEVELSEYQTIDGAVLSAMTKDEIYVDSEGNEHQIYHGWWDAEYYQEDFENPIVLDSYLDEDGQAVNLYEYTFFIPQTLVDLKLCDGVICPEVEFYLEVYVHRDYNLMAEQVNCVEDG